MYAAEKVEGKTMVEQWGLFEIELQGAQEGNPFLDVELFGRFQCGDVTLKSAGFYDGNGRYKIRCMPTQIGAWTYTTQSNMAELDGQTGAFNCVAPSENNHGPVSVHNQFHFAYADGTSFTPFGTTCYAWTHQGNALEEQTLRTLSEKPFNKIRMCVFPKHYPFNRNEPVYYPFEQDVDGNSNFTRVNPQFFHHFEQRLNQLLKLAIEADIIIWHPYDRWGYAEMDEESDYRYLRYLIARLSAYRNVWWSLANEYDFMLKSKPMARWDNFFRILREEDPYQHLRSIHNGAPDANYDHTKPDVTHVSIQHWDVKQVQAWRKAYGKAIVNDELQYEGNITFPWGNISSEEVVHRFWIMVVNGCYAGHGETYMHPEDILWWSKGGILHGDSWKGIGFLRDVIKDAPAGGLTPIADVNENALFPPKTTAWHWSHISGGTAVGFFLVYLGEHQMQMFPIWAEDDDYEVAILDTREMTITPGRLQKVDTAVVEMQMYSGTPMPTYLIELPSKPYLAVRIKRNGSKL